MVARSWDGGENTQQYWQYSGKLQWSNLSKRFHLHPKATLQTAEHQSNSVSSWRPGAFRHLPSAPSWPASSHIRCRHDQRHPQLGTQCLHNEPPTYTDQLWILCPCQLTGKLPQPLCCTEEYEERERPKTRKEGQTEQGDGLAHFERVVVAAVGHLSWKSSKSTSFPHWWVWRPPMCVSGDRKCLHCLRAPAWDPVLLWCLCGRQAEWDQHGIQGDTCSDTWGGSTCYYRP